MELSGEINSFSEDSICFQFDIDNTHEESDICTNFSEVISQLKPSPKLSLACCPNCQQNYHNTRRTPLLLPSCGHTVCYPCAQLISKDQNSFTCPVCGTEIAVMIQYLPINFSLLDLTVQDNTLICEKHCLEFAAFCKEEEELLCGACVLEHRSHDLCSLSDGYMELAVIKAKIDIIEKLQNYRYWKDTWVKGIEKMAWSMQQIESSYERKRTL